MRKFIGMEAITGKDWTCYSVDFCYTYIKYSLVLYFNVFYMSSCIRIKLKQEQILVEMPFEFSALGSL